MSAPAVVELVQRARRRRAVRSLVESSALGIAAGLFALAAAVLSSRAQSPAWALAACAALSGLAMAATWWVERAKATELELAERIDARLERGGALRTAYEARARGDASPVARLLETRALAGLDRGSLARALPPAGPIWLAPPALAAALLALVFELPAARELVFVDARADGAAREIAESHAKAALQRAREQGAAARGDAGLRAQLVRELDLALAELREPSGAAGASSPSAQGLGGELRAARAELAGAEKSLAADPGLPAGELSGADSAAGAGSSEEGARSLLTNGAPDRTMSGSNRPTAAANGARPATREPSTGSPGEAGALAGRWWDERYDPVVQGWRAVLAARGEGR